LDSLKTGITIIGSGSATSAQLLSNEDLSEMVETSDEWIQTRTGMRQRHICSPDESLADLAAQAGRRALEMAGIGANEIDLIILATSTPDDLFGSAGKVQALLGASQAVAFDLTAACSGFVFGMVTAAQFLRTGVYQRVLLIGGDVLSRWVDWSDRSTCVLFGDGAGAVVLQGQSDRDHLLAFEIYTDGNLNHSLNLSYQGQPRSLTEEKTITQGNYQPISMNGREVYRFAVARVPEVIEKVLFKAQLEITAINWLILHQANQRIMDAVGDRLQLPSEKIISNLAQYGNTSAASIPIALDEAVRAGKIQTGDLIAASGFGAGLSWGAILFRWG
jgi:3-oxoacyl-[acyl-carrier-protein] synthase-3